MMLLAHVSDLHIDGTDRAHARVAAVFRFLNRLTAPLDAVLVTGDLVDNGRTAEYEELAKLLDAPAPLLMCPGNHDSREPYRRVLLGGDGGDRPINVVHRVAGAVFAMCDSSIPGQTHGRLDEETLGWLEGVLDETPPDDPVFVCFHHQPVMLYSPFIDAIRQYDEQPLADLVARHPNVVALLCGHAHTASVSTFAGRPLLVAPGVASTLKFPWEPDEGLDLDAPVAIAFHILDDDRRLTTHYRVVPVEFDG